MQQAQASVQNIDAQIAVQQAQISATEAQLNGRRPRWCSHSNRLGATRRSRRTAGAPFRMISSIRPNCISRKPPCRQRWETSIWRSGKSIH